MRFEIICPLIRIKMFLQDHKSKLLEDLQLNHTQDEKTNQVQEETIIIGIDIASEVQYARAFD